MLKRHYGSKILGSMPMKRGIMTEYIGMQYFDEHNYGIYGDFGDIKFKRHYEDTKGIQDYGAFYQYVLITNYRNQINQCKDLI